MNSTTNSKPVPQFRAFGSNGTTGLGTLTDIVLTCVRHGIDADLCEADDRDGAHPIGLVESDGTAVFFAN